MAGAGYHDFAAGDKPTAAQFDTFLMEQTCMVFADAAARDTALSAVKSEGMLAYLLDVNCMTVYSGSAWSSIGPVHGDGIAWTPTVTQSGSVTVTVTRGRYWRMGRRIEFEADLAVTGSGTGSNAVVLSLPVAATTALANPIGWGVITDSSVSNWYGGELLIGTTSTTARIRATSTTLGDYLGANGFTAALANGDFIRYSGRYTAAADA